jgi:prepilin-type N-terminal cleavage/methylation domain-containing protein
MKKRLREMREDRGFTLIELLIVITILGILAGIVVFAVSGISDKGKNAACNAEKTTIQTAEESNFAKTQPGVYTGMAGLVANGLLTNATTNYWTVATPTGTATAATYTMSKVDTACP